MATKPLEWPHNAKEARDTAAEEANRVLRVLRPLLDDGRIITRDEYVTRIAKAIDAAQTIARWLEKVGAETTP